VKLSNSKNWDCNFNIIDQWIFIKLHISCFNYSVYLSLFRKLYFILISFFIFNKNLLIALRFKFNFHHLNLLWNIHIYYVFKTLKMFKIDEICCVKRWHHTNSIAIVSYISNTLSNPRSARNWPTGVKGVHRQWFKLVTFWTYSLTMNLNHWQRWPRHHFTQVIMH